MNLRPSDIEAVIPSLAKPRVLGEFIDKLEYRAPGRVGQRKGIATRHRRIPAFGDSLLEYAPNVWNGLESPNGTFGANARHHRKRVSPQMGPHVDGEVARPKDLRVKLFELLFEI